MEFEKPTFSHKEVHSNKNNPSKLLEVEKESQKLCQGVIKALPQSVCSAIAAGEIVTSPQAVIKELVENSFDAQATEVIVSLVKGGFSSLVVRDNGKGISRDDLLMLGPRHRTSKLESVSDFAKLSTFGFRGEALSSICYASILNIISKQANSTHAWSATYMNGNMISEPVIHNFNGDSGTIINVSQLFHNNSKRKNHTQTSSSINAITGLLKQLSITNPSITFILTDSDNHNVCRLQCNHIKLSHRENRFYNYYGTLNTSEQIQSDKDGLCSEPPWDLSIEAEHKEEKHYELSHTLKQRVQDILGSKVAPSIIHLSGSVDNSEYSILINKSYTERINSDIIIAINGRLVNFSSLQNRLRQVAEPLLNKQKPWLAISIRCPPSELDVNRHPSKREVSLINEMEIQRNITKALGIALQYHNGCKTFIKGFVNSTAQPAPQHVARSRIDPTQRTFYDFQNSIAVPAIPAPVDNSTRENFLRAVITRSAYVAAISPDVALLHYGRELYIVNILVIIEYGLSLKWSNLREVPENNTSLNLDICSLEKPDWDKLSKYEGVYPLIWKDNILSMNLSFLSNLLNPKYSLRSRELQQNISNIAINTAFKLIERIKNILGITIDSFIPLDYVTLKPPPVKCEEEELKNWNRTLLEAEQVLSKNKVEKNLKKKKNLKEKFDNKKDTNEVEEIKSPGEKTSPSILNLCDSPNTSKEDIISEQNVEDKLDMTMADDTSVLNGDRNLFNTNKKKKISMISSNNKITNIGDLEYKLLLKQKNNNTFLTKDIDHITDLSDKNSDFKKSKSKDNSINLSLDCSPTFESKNICSQSIIYTPCLTNSETSNGYLSELLDMYRESEHNNSSDFDSTSTFDEHNGECCCKKKCSFHIDHFEETKLVPFNEPIISKLIKNSSEGENSIKSIGKISLLNVKISSKELKKSFNFADEIGVSDTPNNTDIPKDELFSIPTEINQPSEITKTCAKFLTSAVGRAVGMVSGPHELTDLLGIVVKDCLYGINNFPVEPDYQERKVIIEVTSLDRLYRVFERC